MVQKYEKRLKREKFTCYFFQKTDSKTFMPFLASNFRKTVSLQGIKIIRIKGFNQIKRHHGRTSYYKRFLNIHFPLA